MRPGRTFSVKWPLRGKYCFRGTLDIRLMIDTVSMFVIMRLKIKYKFMILISYLDNSFEISYFFVSRLNKFWNDI